MADALKGGPKRPPKGGRKGGTIYPHLNLQKALEYAKKLVSKTHTGAQPEDEILPGVFGNSGPEGKVRISALKQFGLIEGDAKGYQATALAKEIDAALESERPRLLQRAVLVSKVFNKIFDTFHGDNVSKAQVAKRAKELGVHPDSADECARIFVESAATSGLGTLNGESLALVSAATADAADASLVTYEETQQAASVDPAAAPEAARGGDVEPEPGPSPSRRQGLTVSLNVDSSSDPDKLEKQLKLLREYGVI